MKASKKRVLKAIVAAAVSVILFAISAVLIKALLLPRLPTQWQSDLIWLGGALLTTVAVLAGLAELTGYSLRDLSSLQHLVRPDEGESNRGAIVLNAEDRAKVNWAGDVLLGNSTKVVIERSDTLGSPEANEKETTGRLIADIQSALYGRDDQLPWVLTLCLDLCDRAGLSDKYELWLKKELTGYHDYSSFQKQFRNEDQFEAWMGKWASHRLVEPYVKVMYRSQESGRQVIDKWPMEKALVSLSVAEIARTIQEAKNVGSQEIYANLAAVSPKQFEELKQFLSKELPGVRAPSDLQLFHTISSLERILDGTREIVLSLLSDARAKAV